MRTIFPVLVVEVGTLGDGSDGLIIGLLVSLTLSLLFGTDMTPASTTGIEFQAVFVTDLTTTPSTTKLTSLSVAVVQI